jgi:hypothetical protein
MANVKVSGQVYRIFEKQWNGKTLRSVRLDGNPLYYRWGDKDLPAGVVGGAFVSFDAEPKDDQSAQIKGGILVNTAAQDKIVNAPSKPANTQSNSSSGSVSSRAVDWEAKDASIRYQSARKDAIAFLALPGVLDGIVGKAKPSDKLGIVEATVDRYTAAFYEDIGTFGAVTRANAVAEPTPGADDSDEE